MYVLFSLLVAFFFFFFFFFFFNDTATTEIYTLSLHDALPIGGRSPREYWKRPMPFRFHEGSSAGLRSEEHTSELHSRENLVCRLLLEKKKKNTNNTQNKKKKKKKKKKTTK